MKPFGFSFQQLPPDHMGAYVGLVLASIVAGVLFLLAAVL